MCGLHQTFFKLNDHQTAETAPLFGISSWLSSPVSETSSNLPMLVPAQDNEYAFLGAKLKMVSSETVPECPLLHVKHYQQYCDMIWY